MRIDPNLSSIHAYLCADGYVIKNPESQKHKYYHIGLRNTNMELLKDFQNKFYKYFKIKPHLVKERCRIQSKEIYEELTNNFGSFYSKDWELPKLNKNNIKYWLRSYFDCEAWVRNQERQNRHIGLDSINENGIYQIKKELGKLGIVSKVKKRNTRNIYTLNIYGKENLIKFQNKINFLHPEKKEKLQSSINSYMNYIWKNNFKEIFRKRARLKKDNNVVRLCSILKTNLEKMNKFLKNNKIESKIYKRTNGLNKIYYELSIYGKENINKLNALNLINNERKIKEDLRV